jgi:hypothetical protein
MISTARAAARTLPHYHELRYEDLLDDPEAKLREVCAFLGLGLRRAHARPRRQRRAARRAASATA